MATENILMEAVKKGGDRQELHERIRIHSMEAAKQVKQNGLSNDLIDRIAADPIFNISKEELMSSISAERFIGRAPGQVVEFIEEYIKPILEQEGFEDTSVEINV
jgi:adenylosuccinate lyase